MKNSTILIIEDDTKIAELIQLYVKEEGFRPVHVADGQEGLNLALKIQPALIILDRMLPGLEGTEVLKKLRQSSECPVIFLTAKGDEIERIIGLELGADDYVSKPFSPKELMARVKAILRRGKKKTEALELVHIQDLTLNPEKMSIQKGSKSIDCSLLEFKLLHILASQPGRVFSREQLMDHVYDESDHFVFDRTIDAHIKNLRKKLGDKARSPKYIGSVFGVGYKFIES